MMLSVFWLFFGAAIFGILNASFVLNKKYPPIPLVVFHGILAASGLALFALRIMTHDTPVLLYIAMIFFLVGALMGFFLLSYHVRNKIHPTPLLLAHVLSVITGFCILTQQIFFLDL